MRTALAIAALALPLSPTAARKVPGLAPDKNCGPASGVVSDRDGLQVGPRKLGELPPANSYKALWNVVDGCPKPIVIRRGLGASEGRRR